MTDNQKLKHIHTALQKKFKDKKFVFGRGPIGAKIVFVGETIDTDAFEDAQPLNRDSERLLNQLLRAAGIDKKKIYVTNVVKYLPTRDHSISPKEIKSHATFLKEEVKTINPLIVVTLGNLALNGIGMRQPLDNVHGRTFNLGSYELLPTYHPEHALRDPRIKEILANDFSKLKDLLKSKQTSQAN